MRMVPINSDICQLKNYFRKLYFITRCYSSADTVSFVSFFMFNFVFLHLKFMSSLKLRAHRDATLMLLCLRFTFAFVCYTSNNNNNNNSIHLRIFFRVTHTLNWRTLPLEGREGWRCAREREYKFKNFSGFGKFQQTLK